MILLIPGSKVQPVTGKSLNTPGLPVREYHGIL